MPSGFQVMVLASAILAGLCGPLATEEQSAQDNRSKAHPGISEAFEKIESDYHHKMRGELVRDRTREELLAITRTWHTRLHDLLDSVEDSKLDSLSAEDLAAAAQAAEYLQRRDECIQYARRAITKDATTEDAYSPLIRSLLNIDRAEEAAAILDAARDDLPFSSRIYALHYITYHKAKRDENHKLAFAQIETYFQWLSERLQHDMNAPVQMRRHLEEFVQAHHADEVQADFSENRNALVTKVQEATQHNLQVREETEDARGIKALNKHIKELELLRERLRKASRDDNVE